MRVSGHVRHLDPTQTALVDAVARIASAELLEGDPALEPRQGDPQAGMNPVAEAERDLLLAVDVDRADEAQAVMPMSTISVTEDMATAMRLHSMGWKSVYHDEVLAVGLAPEDLRTALQDAGVPAATTDEIVEENATRTALWSPESVSCADRPPVYLRASSK